jgi:hypothetical protein
MVMSRTGVPPQDITGMTFGYLTAVRSVGKSNSHGALWECLCRCGKTVVYVLSELKRASRSRGIRHNGIPKSCGCARRGVRSPRYLGAGDLSGQKWANLRRGAERRGFSFEITVQEAWALFETQERRCAMTGVPISLHPSSMEAGANTASLDRIDSKKGYTVENVQWVHVVVNMMKQTLSNQDLVSWCGAVTDYARGETFGLGTPVKPHNY